MRVRALVLFSATFALALVLLLALPVAAAVQEPAEGTDNYVLVLLGLVLGVLATAVLFAWHTLHQDRQQPGMGSGDDPIWADRDTPVEPELTAVSEPFWRRAESGPAEGAEVTDEGSTTAGEQEAPASA